MGRPPGHSAGFEARREEIIDAAAELFARKGYAATGTVELGAHVGLAKGALYHYIGSKEELLVAIQERVLTPLLASTRALADLDVTPLVRLRLISEVLMDTIVSRLPYIWVYEHDYRHLGAERKQQFMERRREFEGLVHGCIDAAVAAGALREMDTRLATLQFLNLHNHTYQWVRPDGRYSAADLSEAYCQTLFRGWADSIDYDAVEQSVQRLRRLMGISRPSVRG